MKIYREIVLDSETGETLAADWFEYDGPVTLCKGGMEAAQQQAFMLQEQEMALQQQMLGLFQNQLKQVGSVVDPMIAAGGMPADERAALTSLAMNTLPATYNSLYGALQNRLVQRGVVGGQMAGGGDIARQFGALGASEAGQQANLLSQIPIRAQQQLMQELGLKMGIAGQYGGQAQGFNSGAINALGQEIGAARANVAASTGLWGSLFGALSSPFTGGFNFGGGSGGGSPSGQGSPADLSLVPLGLG